jgi:lysophospholipase L1-like esterase
MTPETEQLVRDSLRGVAEIDHGQSGLKFSRLASKYARFHDHDALTQKVADQGSGVCISVVTSASSITLTYRSTRDATLDRSYIGSPSVTTLTCGDYTQSVAHDNGDLRVWDGSTVAEIAPGEDSVATFEIPALGIDASQSEQLVELWLPQDCNIEIVDLAANAPLHSAAATQPKWVHYGSSISHCIESDGPTGVWPVIVARKLGLNLYSLGLAGSANIELFAAHAIAELQPQLVTLKLGINTVNGRHLTVRSFIPTVHSFLDAIREQHPTIPIIVISPIICPGHEELPGPTRVDEAGLAIGSELSDLDWVGDLTLVTVRSLLSEIVARREDPNLNYLDGLELFGPEDIDMLPDGLHPNAAGYRLMGQRFSELLPSLVNLNAL